MHRKIITWQQLLALRYMKLARKQYNDIKKSEVKNVKNYIISRTK